jgi:hypothetical protein
LGKNETEGTKNKGHKAHEANRYLTLFFIFVSTNLLSHFAKPAPLHLTRIGEYLNANIIWVTKIVNCNENPRAVATRHSPLTTPPKIEKVKKGGEKSEEEKRTRQ